MRQTTMLESLKPFLKRPIMATFLLGISSGFPLTIVLSLMSGWLKDSGVSKTDIGLFALVTIPYLLKPLWAPFIDGIKLGAFARYFGHRRSWLLIIQVGLLIAIFTLTRFDPALDLKMVAILAIIITFFSASQDIVIDAYRIEIVDEKSLGHGATMINFGYRFGNLIAGYTGFVLADIWGWQAALSILGFLVIPGALAIFWVGEPEPVEISKEEQKVSPVGGFSKFLYQSVFLPFKEFMTRPSWLVILLFVLFLKMGDALADLMMTPFHLELGFTKTEIANYSKFFGTIALLVGVAVGPFLYFRMGALKSLFVSAILMMLTNLIFIWAYYQGHDVTALAISVAAEKFATGVGGTLVVAYLSSLCNHAFTATQYALLSALAGVGRTIIGSSSGYLVDKFGWVDFFLITTAAAVPGIILLLMLWRRDVAGSPQ